MSRNSLKKHMSRDALKWGITAVVLVLLMGAVIGIGVTLNKQITTITLRPSAYAVGTLDEKGEYKKDTSTIYTKNAITVDGLQIKLAEKAEIQYKLYFYGENDKEEATFISATEWLTANFNGTIPSGAKTVRIVIDPLNDAEVSALEVRGFANQLEVTYNR